MVERWEGATGAYIHNTYGLTETAAPSHLVPRGERAPVDPESGALSVGRPIADTESTAWSRGRRTAREAAGRASEWARSSPAARR